MLAILSFGFQCPAGLVALLTHRQPAKSGGGVVVRTDFPKKETYRKQIS